VYASFVERVAILGGESSGKSTLARALAERFRTSWVAEYGRALWEEKHGELEFDDLLRIARRQIELEQSAAESAVRYLFCDTTPLVTRFYSNALFGRVDPALDTLCERPYSLFVLCAPDIPFDQDGTRRDEAFRLEQHEHYLQALRARNLPYLLVRGSVDERIAQVIRRLEARPSAQGLRRG
jgi:NadR type nicotinamide-nucleotide adenylyltransferase